ncbi:hypothetical protein [Sphingomonas sp. VDB2]|uniref:hypothetical protein n=1 Tax=Sphingomonas sp. VDB2 TaxID=3228751 RepID=UPI003A803091
MILQQLDGDFNVGLSDPKGLVEMVRYNREDSAGVQSNYWRQELIQLASLAA